MDIAARLQEWGRWVRVRMLQGHCKSLEHRYRPKSRPDDTPTGWGEYLTTMPPKLLPAVDVGAAVEIEAVMRYLPKRHRKALKLVYVYRMPDRWCARRMAIRFVEWPEFLETAHRMVINNLARKSGVVPIRLQMASASATLVGQA